MKITEIKRIEEILLVDKPLLKHKVVSLVNPFPAENGGSFLLRVDLRLKNDKNFEEKFEVVAKLASTSSNGIDRRQAFQNEITFYKNIVPLLAEFLRLQGADALDLFPKYYGGRLTLNSRSKEADKDGLFFLENLQKSGYKTVEPHIGLDKETTRLVLKQLAIFHASLLAMKIKKPEIFKHKIKPSINKTEVTVDTDEIKRVVSLMWGNEGCVSLIPRIRRAMAQKQPTPREPLSTILHNNLCTENIMVKLDDAGNCESVKFVDFQHYDYGSPANDLLFFLFTSVEISVLEGELDNLFRHYHIYFISELKGFELEDFTDTYYSSFWKEIAAEATTGLFSRIMMKLNNTYSSKFVKEHEERAWYLVQEFAKQNWI